MIDITPKKNRFSIGKTEAAHILIAAVVMSVAFTLLFRSGSITNYFRYHFGDMYFAGMFGVMFVIVVLSFIGHEFGHKFVAQMYGMWSEFRMYPFGLVLTLFSSFCGFLIAAPGAVMIRGDHYSAKEDCNISVAGPLVNIILSAVGLVGVMVFNSTVMLVPFYLLLTLNSSLALFNLIPVPPLDGSKIIGNNTPLWIACIAIAALEFGSRWLLPTLYWA